MISFTSLTPPMKRMLMLVVIFFGIIFSIYGIKKALFSYGFSHYEPPPVTISAAKATTQTWQSYLSSVGTLTAVNGADISAEVPGIVKEIRFNSGQFVHQGDILVLLDSSIEQAQLKIDSAKVALAQINFDRHKTLLNKSVVAQSEFDTVSEQLDEAKAALEQTQARIRQKTLTAPFSGKIGIRQINVGQYVSAGTPMVTLQSLDPLYVQFNLPEQYLPDLYLQQPIDVMIRRQTPDNTVKTLSWQGEITAINSKIDQTTRNILLQATLSNKELQLYPGMFVQVKIWLRARNQVITLPETAISYSLHGDSVFVIKEKNPITTKNKFILAFHRKSILYVEREYVKVGEQRDNQVVILEGLKGGEQVVTSGQLKLQNGTHVIIDNSVEM